MMSFKLLRDVEWSLPYFIAFVIIASGFLVYLWFAARREQDAKDEQLVRDIFKHYDEMKAVLEGRGKEASTDEQTLDR